MGLFIDTWGWVSIHNQREPRHKEVKSFYDSLRRQGVTACTTDYVLDETFTLLFRRLSFYHARESLTVLDEAVQRGYLQLEWISPARFKEAQKLRLKLQDKPRISFTDLTSMIVANELGIANILTDDVHFTQVGMGLSLVP